MGCNPQKLKSYRQRCEKRPCYYWTTSHIFSNKPDTYIEPNSYKGRTRFNKHKPKAQNAVNTESVNELMQNNNFRKTPVSEKTCKVIWG